MSSFKYLEYYCTPFFIKFLRELVQMDRNEIEFFVFLSTIECKVQLLLLEQSQNLDRIDKILIKEFSEFF